MTYFVWTRRDTLRSVLGLAGAATAAGCATTEADQAALSAPATFLHGVASGDPLRDRVVIWTRATPEASGGAQADAIVRVRWVVARDAALTDVVREGERQTDAARDFTVKIDVDGLEAGTAYHYGFFVGETASPVGRTKTLPDGPLDQLVIAAVSCSNFPFGYFHAYQDIADRGEADLVVHLGDYIYEYGKGSYGDDVGRRIGRAHTPETETVSLSDYRIRHAQYRTDAGLQNASAAAPWITSWDDHEVTNNPWRDGAQNHSADGSEGTWADRVQAALQAYFEWMPVRDPEPGRAQKAFWRAFEFGDLASLIVLETRLTGRSEQLSFERDLPFIETVFDMSDPDNPVAVTDADTLAALDPAVLDTVRTPFDMTGPTPKPILDYSRVRAFDPANLPPGVAFLPNTEAFRTQILADEARTMITPEQERFVVEAVAGSVKAGKPWQVLANQVIFARQASANLDAAWDQDTKDRLLAQSPWVERWIRFSTLELPANMDAWDGYPAQRDRLSDAFSDAGASMVVLTGDTHTAWANTLHDTRGARIGAEFGATGVSSPSWVNTFAGAEPSILELIMAANEEITWGDGAANGYVQVTFTREMARADFIAVSDVTQPTFEAEVFKTWVQRRRGADGTVPPLTDATGA